MEETEWIRLCHKMLEQRRKELDWPRLSEGPGMRSSLLVPVEPL